jgi:predicted dehydrogenase
MYDRQMAYFIKCVKDGINPTPGGGEGRINLAVIDAAYRSAQSGAVEEVQC